MFDIERRVHFTRLDDTDLAQLHAFAPVVREHIDVIISDFYDHILKVPALQALFSNPERVAFAKQRQKTHWLESIFSGRIDQTYVQSAVAIGRTHARIGLDPRWYIGGYAFILTRLVNIAVSCGRFTPEELPAVINAVNKIIFLDMDLAISVYIKEAQEQARTTLRRHADVFEQNVKEIVDAVSSSAAGLQGTAETMAAAAEETSVQARVVAEAAMRSRDSTEGMQGQVASANALVADAVTVSARTRESVEALEQAALTISDFASTIRKIASQTNLLALNATIEAARAGEAGKGFAVVANEVKSLASEVANATNEIAQRIDAIKAVTRDTGTQIDAVSATIGRISDVFQVIATSMEQQSGAVHEVSTNISGVREAAHETGRASTETLGAASTLAQQAAQLTERVDDFLRDIQN
ncbi:protoglobin domain-containing protein [Parapedomonas caeni]